MSSQRKNVRDKGGSQTWHTLCISGKVTLFASPVTNFVDKKISWPYLSPMINEDFTQNVSMYGATVPVTPYDETKPTQNQEILAYILLKSISEAAINGAKRAWNSASISKVTEAAKIDSETEVAFDELRAKTPFVISHTANGDSVVWEND